ncbi:MAG: RHS repeat-associated core domain-containing protein [Cellvibrio sp.]|uniref:RHS repeat domain-containing protein n=1 Tax=Cellvibrio sp. TaxID=1965322 RepID=UPI002727C51F|nr:RHS repeat-associated core domain-containing protein [Cellvibrio sp.]
MNSSLAASYSYNPLGQRTVKTLANGTKEIYHYDEAGHLISVTDGTGATLREYIYWGDQQIALVNYGVVYYIHSDHLNTPQVITDANQQVVWMGDYEPFGKLAANQTNSIKLFSRFPGQYLDNETGLYYNYFRDYDPSIGRYIESDPIGLEGGINTYGYVVGNPVNNIDPKGLLSIRFPWFPFPLPWLFPTPNNPSYPDYYDPIVPFDPTLPLPNTPHDDSDSDDGVNCPPFIKQEEDPLDKERACLAAKKSVLNTCAGLTGAKMMRCYNAAENTYRSCMGYPPLR